MKTKRKQILKNTESALMKPPPFSPIPLQSPFHDHDRSADEQRFIDIGSSEKDRVLVVVYIERGSNIRLVSCRKATPSERKLYEEGHD